MSNLLAIFEVNGIIGTITDLLGSLLYPLFSIIFLLIDGVEKVFMAFAGIGDMTYKGKPITSGNSGLMDDTGIVYYLLQHNIIKNLFTSILLLAIFLMIIFTVMAFIKNVYAAKPKGWKDIIGNAIKGLANFIFIPVCCLLGVWLGNILLQAIYGATSYRGSTSMSKKLFIASAYNANVFRAAEIDENGDSGWVKVTYSDIEELAKKAKYENGENAGKSYWDVNQTTIERHEKTVKNFWGKEETILDPEYYEYYANIVDDIYTQTDKDIYWWGQVWEFYSLWRINYLVLIVGGIFMLYVLGSLCFAMVKRMFYILALFVVSPAVCALYPLDEGKQVGTWKGEFIKQTLSAYGAVAGLNIFFSLLPIIEDLEILGIGRGQEATGLNNFVQLFVMVTGLLIVKDLIGLFSGFAGGDNAYATGSALMKSSKSAITSNIKKVGGGITKTAGVFARAKGAQAAHDGDKKAFWGSLRNQALGGLGKSVGFDMKKIKDSNKEGKEHAWDDYDVRNKAQQKFDDRQLDYIISRAGGKKLDQVDIFNFLNSIKDDKAKAKYEEKIIAHQNTVASRATDIKERALTKSGSLIEGAKSYKDYEEKTLASQARANRRAYEKLENAERERQVAQRATTNIETSFSNNLSHGSLYIARAGFDNASLQAMFKSRQTIDISKLTSDSDKAAAGKFNNMVNAMIKAEEKLETQRQKSIAAQEAYNDSIQSTKDAVKDFAKSLKIDINEERLDDAVKDLEVKIKNTSGALKDLGEDFKKKLHLRDDPSEVKRVRNMTNP